jgi:hypothetical protein
VSMTRILYTPLRPSGLPVGGGGGDGPTRLCYSQYVTEPLSGNQF